ncbi:two-component system cell cycle sensor histidine kinase/response regulator CckA [Sphingomonas vulcanisoli]|uniref:histidine kinase n=1 Tax=Sphingomonas vulcanisoli TaxID=1658060 RepID=A0ABX0TS88_9SPHN|nr:response regulator [Sphingomonas vulcanisoli]NIJ07009.1 two-component system cell cycle sensor histidine kinase/response regulator CckA [Sphingomonas vulcanisoli]
MASSAPILWASPDQRRDDRLLIAGVIGAALLSAACACLLLAPMDLAVPLASFFGGAGLVAGVMLTRPARAVAGAIPAADWPLIRTVLEDAVSPTAITTRMGRMVCANPAWEEMFGGLPAPRDLPLVPEASGRLIEAARTAWRDGTARVEELEVNGRPYVGWLRRCGRGEEYLIWRLRPSHRHDLVEATLAMANGLMGDRLGHAGVMLALVDAGGSLIGGNEGFRRRATGQDDAAIAGLPLTGLIEMSEEGQIRLTREGEDSAPLRVVAIPLETQESGESENDGETPIAGATAFLLLDEDPDALTAAAARRAATGHLHELLAMLPLGIALAERDGRFLFLNEAFARAAGLARPDAAVYPSDLVVKEDKAAVIEAVRRFTAGRALPGDLAVRLASKPDEPVALTIANAKGLGEAAVLLSLKDNSEESKLKRQIAQATKMQAVGQLAGGVAHDFNNILTAIIGHCDLMAMRHMPGDIDYDDIQQIKHNSNRAAALTRQLLAFSRQQTLRPQLLQLPEVISEITNLLRRLLGETVRLEVKHGRNLGTVRADPGQLEQVIVNLAVNARDAMPEGGRVTLETFAVPARDVRRMRSDIMPIQDYTALKVSDTGFGIPQDNLSKIFEPFFTTKEVGKGTGLGLSTVYGIVKQTDGFIFAESDVGHGTSFVMYLPVHEAGAADAGEAEAAPVRVEGQAGELWGSGTILLVEDETMVRAVAERALTRQGYRVLTATNGEEALELLDDIGGERFDLLITDVVMPAMDGPTLVSHARQRFPEMKIIFMSGYAEEQLRSSIELKDVAFLPKPFSVQQIGQAAHDALMPA